MVINGVATLRIENCASHLVDAIFSVLQFHNKLASGYI